MNDHTDIPLRQRPWYRRALPIACTATALALVGAVGLGAAVPAASAASASVASSVSPAYLPGGGSGYGPGGSGSSGYGSGGSGYGGGYSSYGSGSGVAAATEASASESTGLVLIETVLGYQDAAAAGTGMVLTSGGLVLTNNHVVEGSTEISVTIASTGQTYTATVVGTNAADDVALLQLQGASGLSTVTIDDDGVDVGDAMTAVGNAEGGGVLMAADGVVTGLDTSVTTAAEGSVDSETLDGMIQVAADVVAGDSGGAVLDAEGEVVGMTTAASTGGTTTAGWAIPIDDALQIAQQIVDGDESDGVTIGYPAFLGVQLAQTTSNRSGTQRSTASGAVIAGVVEGTPAEAAGLGRGDTITSVDGTAVTSATLSQVLGGYDPGDSVTITWVDSAGSSHSAAVTLAEGPVA